jgi:peroxiredoxin
MAKPELPHLDFDQIGPRLGEHFPDLRLPDQHGNLVDLHAARGSGKALVIFHRSARW